VTVMKDLRELPKVRDSYTYLYFERCKIEQDGKSVSAFDESGKVQIPCAALMVLMLGPGTSITHAAVKTLVENGVLIIWAGEYGVRYYAQGNGETRNASNLIKQARLVSVPSLRLKVIRALYEMRFEDKLPADLTLEQIRGLEGIRVREAYRKASKENGVEWRGRQYQRDSWNASDPINRALSTANSCLYGICHSAIVSYGLSPGLGFIHFGQQLSFVYDIGDLYKTHISIPAAFAACARPEMNLEREVRMRCRDYFKEHQTLKRIIQDLERIIGLCDETEADHTIIDSSLEEGISGSPSQLWRENGNHEIGGQNWAFIIEGEGEKNGRNDT